jgi:predicted transglutaminase-like cysteine proteinase
MLLPIFTFTMHLLVPPETVPSRTALEPSKTLPQTAVYSDWGMSGVTFANSAPPSWEQMATRYEEQLFEGNHPWSGLVTRLDGIGNRGQLRQVNTEINRANYVADSDNWRTADYWATPFELFNRGGDCEDFAIAKYMLLREMGIAASALHIAVGMHHAFLIVNTKEGPVVLDNRQNSVRPLTVRDQEDIIFTVNELGWTVNVDRDRQVPSSSIASTEIPTASEEVYAASEQVPTTSGEILAAGEDLLMVSDEVTIAEAVAFGVTEPTS